MKRLGKIIAALALIAAVFAATGCQKKVTGMKVGMTVQDLSNQIWAGSCESLRKLVEADGGQFTYLDCKSNVSTQIGQIENFIAKKVDIIVIQAAEKNAVETTLKAARSAGIKVFCWDDNLTNSDINWVIDNYQLGRMIGGQAALWINEKLGGSAEVAVLDYPQMEILLQRGNGIVDAIKEGAPNAKIVAQSSAINPTEGQNKTETFFQSNPNLKVIACIGGGGAIGANNAVKAANKLTPDFGIFAADATPEELQAIKNNEACRMSVMITGGPDAIAAEIFGWLKKLYAGEAVPHEVYRTIFPVTSENVNQYL
jgi:ribose transport system substrate-binding protein